MAISNFAEKTWFFILLLAAVAFEVAGDILFKKWALAGRNIFLTGGSAIYFVGTIFWAISLRYEYLSKAISIFTIINLITVVFAGIIFFKEDITLVNKIGIFLGIVSVMMIEF